ncbi:MAG: glutamate 5-kinase [Pseudobdellovibrio sp.]
MAKKQRWVIKAGSNMVCSGGPLLLRSWAQQIQTLKSEFNVEVIWVTSGAISTAREKLKLKKRESQLSEKQALSAIGQPIVMGLYNMALQAEGLEGAQILLTYDDMANSKRRNNLKATIETLLKWKITPVLNENDTVATEEIKFGDNDSLSARVAVHTKADRLVILTDVLGLYDSNPTENPKAQLIQSVDKISKKDLVKPGLRAGSKRGTGGMYSKLLAAQMATKKGVETFLVKGDTPAVLVQLAKGVQIGTRIKAT